MAKGSFSRRKFLQNMGAVGGAWTLSSCTTMDRWIIGDPYDLRDEVVILGGGLAGLTAAFELKKRQIPFKLFEASGRVGGRVQTLYFGENAWADLGGEFVADDHLEFKILLKELGLKLLPPDKKLTQYFLAGRQVSPAELQKALQKLQISLRKTMVDLFRDQSVAITSLNAGSFEKSAFYDSLSLESLLQSYRSQLSPLALDYVRTFAVNRYGLEPEQQSSLHFLNEVSLTGTIPPLFQSRVEGGAGKLTQILAERVVGVIPDMLVKMNRALTDISLRGDVYRLRFKTQAGYETYRTRKIICTLPISKLKEVVGMTDLPFPDGVLAAIQNSRYGAQAKGVVGIEPSATRPLSFWGRMPSQNLWVSQGQGSRLTFLAGGEFGKLAGPGITRDLQQDVRKFSRELKLKDDIQIVNWLHRKWSLGSRMVYAPGDYTKYKGAFSAPTLDGSFLFAGEHTSDRFGGTMQGAIESALRSASRV